MIKSLIQWSLMNRMVVLLGAALLMLWGGYQASRMPVDVFPDLTAPSVTVVAEAHGMSPSEVETLVTFPLETALNGSPGHPGGAADRQREAPAGAEQPPPRAAGAAYGAGIIGDGRDHVHRAHFGHSYGRGA